MKVLFANPPWWAGQKEVALEDGRRALLWTAGVRAGSRWPFTRTGLSAPDRPVRGEYTPYPFFLGYAASYAERAIVPAGGRVFFRDSVALRESYASFEGYLLHVRPDYLVMESATPSWEHDREQIARFHQLLPDLKIILGGPIASQGATLLAEHPLHAVVRGEYEKGVLHVLEGRSGLVDFDLLTGEEMNAAPFPWYDDLHAYAYFDACPQGQAFPHAQVWSSRGCPYKCIFCVWPATMTGNDPDGTGTRTVRHYSQAYMETFLGRLVTAFPAYKNIYFDDDTFNLGNSHVLRMCEVMKKIGKPWSAMCRADTSRMETWEIMRDAGCFGVKLGFESGSQYVVDKIVKKHLDLERAREVVLHLKKLGMTVHGTFTYGLPGETREQMQETRRYIQSLPFDTIQESGTAEIEGTPLATLSRTGHLEGYAGAAIDATYDRQRDGSVKMQRLAQQLQDS